MNYILKHRKAAIIITAVVIVLGAFLGWQRKLTMAKSVYNDLKEEPRGEAIYETDFYYNKLTAKEGEDFLFLKEKMENLEGGVLELPKPLTGKEYQRVVTALEYEGGNTFYGIIDIPMTEDNIYVLHENKDILKVTEEKISKVVLFLSCGEGIHLSGEFAQDGTVTNLSEIEKRLSMNVEEKVQDVQKRKEATQTIMDDILRGIPENSGKKATIEYFLQWLDDNMVFTQNAAATTEGMQDMGDLLEKVYSFNHEAGLTEKRASTLGYAKIFSELCRQAGIDSHVVMGAWNGNWLDDNMYVLCTASIDGQTIYVDASGQKISSLGGKRYISEKEAQNRLDFADYFDYE